MTHLQVRRAILASFLVSGKVDANELMAMHSMPSTLFDRVALAMEDHKVITVDWAQYTMKKGDQR